MNSNMNSNANSNVNSHALGGSKSENSVLASRENDVSTSQNSVLASRENDVSTSQNSVLASRENDVSTSQNGVLASRENDVSTSQNSVLASREKIKKNSLTSYDLKAFLGLQKEISDIEMAINAAYYPVKSPSLSGGFSNDTSDPTSSAFYRIDKYKKQKEEKEKKMYELKKKIENELILLDPLTAAVLELHFLKGLTWKQTNRQLYKKEGDAARKVYKEWKKEKAE